MFYQNVYFESIIISKILIFDIKALFGSISSVEDRGYVVDLGIKGTKAFMKSLDAEKYIQLHNEGKATRSAT